MFGRLSEFILLLNLLEGTLQILVYGLYWYFICVACSAVRKTFVKRQRSEDDSLRSKN